MLTLRQLRLQRTSLERRSRVRELIFGAQDGLLVPLGVVSTVAGAFANNHIVIVAGVSEGLAGAFSMATGAYLAYQAERGVHHAEVERQRLALVANPIEAAHELTVLLERDGLSSEAAGSVSTQLAEQPNVLLSLLVARKLGIEIQSTDQTMGEALLIGGSYLLGAVVPLSPYFFLSGSRAIITSIGATLLALFMIGLLKGSVTTRRYIRNGIQVLLIGVISGLGGYLLGTVLPRWLHLM